MHLCDETLDDLLRKVFEYFLTQSDKLDSIHPRKGDAKEVFGAILELTNPRARLSRTEIKGTPFSCLGELSWYLSGSDELSHMQYYIKRYDEYSDDKKTIHGAYGPRLRNMHGKYNQLLDIVKFLKDHTDSRRAVIQIYDAADLYHDGKDVPCTTTLQFVVRNNKLSMMTSMRSNDVFLGLPHDIFCFTMIQEIIATKLNLELGIYKHSVGSLHLYDTDFDKAKIFISEGWQSTQAMQKMPAIDIESNVIKFINLEKEIREKGVTNLVNQKIDSYWDDLVILLKAFNVSKVGNDLNPIKILDQSLNNKIYSPYMKKLEQKLIREKDSE